MNVLHILEQDHQRVRELFQQARNANDAGTRKVLFNKIDTELEIHAHIEETVFYPAIEEYEEFDDLVTDAVVEHQKVKILLGELEDLAAETHDFGSKLEKLMDAVEHHVQEEEGDMFPKIRELFDEDELEQLGKELESAKGTQHREAV